MTPNPNPPDASGIPIHCAYDRLADVVELIPNPRNPNKHPDKQIALLAKVIRHQGWRAPIVVSNRSGFVVAGHGRLEAAKVLQVEKVPVDFQDFATEADEHAHLVADNRLTELAEIDGDELAGLLSELKAQDIDMDLTGFDADSLGEALNGLALEDSDTQDEQRPTLADRFGVPPFSVLDARQGYWQDRKRAWLALGIQSEIGRGGTPSTSARAEPGEKPTYRQIRGGASPGGSPRPACDYSKRQRGNGKGEPIE